MSPKLRLAAVSDSAALDPLARVTRAIESGGRARPTVVVTVEPTCPLGSPLASLPAKLGSGAIDIALCCGTRLPLTLPKGVRIGAVLRCHEPGYRFVSLQHDRLSQVPAGSRIAVADVGARVQLRHAFPTLVFETEPRAEALVAGLRQGAWEGAAAPVESLRADSELLARSTAIPIEEVLPRVGQGIVVLLLAPDGRFLEPIRGLNDRALEHCFRVERAFLTHLSSLADHVAVAHATQSGGSIELTGVVAEEHGRRMVVDRAGAPTRFGDLLAQQIADSCKTLMAAREHPATGPGPQGVHRWP